MYSTRSAAGKTSLKCSSWIESLGYWDGERPMPVVGGRDAEVQSNRLWAQMEAVRDGSASMLRVASVLRILVEHELLDEEFQEEALALAVECEDRAAFARTESGGLAVRG